MSYWTRILISIDEEDQNFIDHLNLYTWKGFKFIGEDDSLSKIISNDIKNADITELLLFMRTFEFKYPESVQVFVKGEGDMNFGLINLFPEADKTDWDEPRYSYLFTESNFIKELKEDEIAWGRCVFDENLNSLDLSLYVDGYIKVYNCESEQAFAQEEGNRRVILRESDPQKPNRLESNTIMVDFKNNKFTYLKASLESGQLKIKETEPGTAPD